MNVYRNAGIKYAAADYCSLKQKGNKDKREYPLSPDLLYYVPGEQGAGRREPVLLANLNTTNACNQQQNGIVG